jgi:hypothetical protein
VVGRIRCFLYLPIFETLYESPSHFLVSVENFEKDTDIFKYQNYIKCAIKVRKQKSAGQIKSKLTKYVIFR